MRDDIHEWLELTRVPGVGAVSFRLLSDHFGSPGKALRADPNSVREVVGLKAAGAVAKALRTQRPEDQQWAVEEARRARDLGVDIIGLGEERYPRWLKEIHDPPPVLYVRGTLTSDDACAVAIVGSRTPDEYGRKAAERIAGGLARRGVTVVSGLARGIDSIGHRAALEAGGRTMAVLGSGVDTIYPPEHEALAGEIAGAGAVVSAFPLGTSPEGKNFPVRNRIISGLSLGVLVVQAAHARSGSLITARFALDQNRHVFAVPGQAGASVSRETNKLIRQGAVLVEEAEHIIEEIAPQVVEPDPRRVKLSGTARAQAAQATLPEVSRPAPALEGPEARLYESLSTDPITVDDLAARADLAVPEALGHLLTMELNGFIRQLPGKRYIRT